MTRINDNIRSYLKSYIIEDNHSSAIMLTGPWGCGKTHFVKEFIEDFNSDKVYGDINSIIINKKKLMYISLNGVSEKSEIDRKILISYFYFGNKAKYIGFAGHLIEGYAGLYNQSLKPFKDAAKSLEKITFEKLSDFGNNKTIFFDDLERCKMDINETMGYVNDFVEHSGSGVVIICDDKEFGKEEKTFNRIREKCVSRVFNVSPDINAALNFFVLKDEKSVYQDILIDNKDKLINLFDKRKSQNLRVLRNIISDFIKICHEMKKLFPDGIEKIPPRKLLVFLDSYIYFSYGVFAGIIKNDEITTKHFLDAVAENKKESSKEIKEKAEFIEELFSLNDDDSFLSFNLWIEWFLKGTFSEENIESFSEIIPNITENKNENENENENEKDAWYKLWYWRDLKDDAVDDVYREVLTDLDERKYLSAPIVLHTAGILLASSDRKFIKPNKEEIEILMIKYINENGEKLESLSPRSFWEESSAWGGLGYAGSDFEEFKNIKKLIYEKLLIVAENKIDNEKSEIYKMLKNEPDNLYRLLVIDEQRRGFNQISVFNKDDVGKVFKILVKSKDRKNIFDALEERIRNKKDMEEFEKEINFYNKLLEKIDEYVSKKESEGKISAFVLNQICRKEIDKMKKNQLKTIV